MAQPLNVDEAVSRILAQVGEPVTEIIRTEDALNRVLAADVVADIDLPPFANSAMDGFAVRSEDVQEVPAQVCVMVDIPAGYALEQTLAPGEAARIMTGAPVPMGADAVVPVEDTDSTFAAGEGFTPGAMVTVKVAAAPGANIRPVGENIRSGERVLPTGIVLRPQDIGMLAGLGVAEVLVVRKPRVVILSTGDELMAIDAPLMPGKIRDTNSYMLAGLVTLAGGEPIRLPPARDLLDEVRALFQAALAQKPDVLVSTAGVSVGSYDVVRAVLAELGEIDFWRVNVRPGKPLAFGTVRDVPFFGLPGNPVSAMVTFDVFVRPVLHKLAGLPDDTETVMATVGAEITSDGRRTYARVRLEQRDGQLIATTTGNQSSGALMSMVLADGLLIIPEDVKIVKKGEKLPVRLLRKIPT